MDRYEVMLRDTDNGARWTMFFQADSFGHAEEQAKDCLDQGSMTDEIIQIVKDYV